jgi:predicted nucleic acid-binding protein
MTYFVDTSVLARLADNLSTSFPIADRAVLLLHRQQESLCITAQNLIEFRNCATRPQAANGLGLTVSAAEQQMAIFESSFPLLEETPAIFPAWKSLVHAAQVTGKQVHDARLMAVCQVHGVSHLLTFNAPHFLRFAAVLPQIAIVDPASV